MVCYTLGAEVRKPIEGCPGFYMRIDEDLRKSVVFLGIADDTPGNGGIHCCGTGFLIGYDTVGYLVTAKHVAQQLNGIPFLVRVNKKDHTSENIHADNVNWFFHPDPSVDVAVIQFHFSRTKTDYDVLYFPDSVLAVGDQIQRDAVKAHGTIGIGDLTYTIGLFRLMSGEKRNLPIVHLGSIAMVPQDEKIPVKDWNNPDKRIFVEGYLVETQAIQGLSGSPVFVRRTLTMPSVPITMLPNLTTQQQIDFFNNSYVSAPQTFVHLLGIWQSSWDAPPDEIMAVQSGRNVRVPVGIGIVVPAQKIIETLELEELVDMRKKIKETRENKAVLEAATTDSAFPVTRINSGNPSHKEDFMRLANEAAKKQPQDD